MTGKAHRRIGLALTLTSLVASGCTPGPLRVDLNPGEEWFLLPFPSDFRLPITADDEAGMRVRLAGYHMRQEDINCMIDKLKAAPTFRPPIPDYEGDRFTAPLVADQAKRLVEE